jgi:hypothetical protein
LKSIFSFLSFLLLHLPAFSQQAYEISCKPDGNKIYKGLLVRVNHLPGREPSNANRKGLFDNVKADAFNLSKMYVCDAEACGERMISKIGR